MWITISYLITFATIEWWNIFSHQFLLRRTIRLYQTVYYSPLQFDRYCLFLTPTPVSYCLLDKTQWTKECLYKNLLLFTVQQEVYIIVSYFRTGVEQAVACAPVAQRARFRPPVGTSFLGEFFRSFSSPVRQLSWSFRSPWFSEYHLAIIIIIIIQNHSLRAPMTFDVDAP